MKEGCPFHFLSIIWFKIIILENFIFFYNHFHIQSSSLFHSDDYQRVFRCSSTRLLSGIYVAHPSSIPREDISINCELFFLCKVSHVYDKRWINFHSCYFFFSQNSYIYTSYLFSTFFSFSPSHFLFRKRTLVSRLIFDSTFEQVTYAKRISIVAQNGHLSDVHR